MSITTHINIKPTLKDFYDSRPIKATMILNLWFSVLFARFQKIIEFSVRLSKDFFFGGKMPYNVQHFVMGTCNTSKQELVMSYYSYVVLKKAEPSSGQILNLFLALYPGFKVSSLTDQELTINILALGVFSIFLNRKVKSLTSKKFSWDQREPLMVLRYSLSSLEQLQVSCRKQECWNLCQKHVIL